MSEKVDFVVIGSGAGGSAAAARLCEGGASVLLAEKGSPASTSNDALRAIGKYYTNEGLSAAMGNCLLPIPTGEVLGGTTRINSGTCLKTPKDLLRRWEAVEGFRADGFEPHLDEAWRRLKVKPVPEETQSRSTKLFFKGLDSLGISGGHALERGEDGCVGSSRCCFICPRDAKMSAEKAYLAPLLGKPGFEVACETELVSLAPGKNPRVTLRSESGTREVECKAVVLACGTLRTPYFLRRFGLGRAPAGDALSVHPATKVFALFDEKVESDKGVPQAGGLLDPDEPRIRYEGIHMPLELAAMSMPFEGRELRRWMDVHERIATFGFMIRDESRGSVRYPVGPRLPWLSYRLQDGDLARMTRAMRFLGKVFFAAGARKVVLPLNRPGSVFETAAQLQKADLSDVRAADLQMMAFHPLGTCGMGRVVDGNLKAADGVYVADGSVVPESLGVNPQITIYAFALRLAEHLLGVPA